MEKPEREQSAQASAAPWAELSPRDQAKNRQALLAAWLAGRGLRGRLAVRWAAGLAALAVLLGITAWGFWAMLHGSPVAWWQFLLPALVTGVVLVALGDQGLRRKIRRDWKNTERAALYADRLHLETEDGETDLPLADLALVRRFAGWTVLVWQQGLRTRAFTFRDETCAPGEEILYARLQNALPGVRFRHSWKPPRPRRHLVLSVLVVLVYLFAELTLARRAQGMRFYWSHNESYDSVVVTRWKDGLYSPDTGYFACEVDGEPQFQWMGSRCCAVTYPAPDGSLRVQLLEADQGKVARLDPDPPTGTWQSDPATGKPTVTLRWDEQTQCYHLTTDQGEQVYRQWQDFDGLGIALCDDRGLPRWTVTPYISVRDWMYSGQAVPTLQIWPVTAEKNRPVTLYNAEPQPSTDDTAAEFQFTDTVDVCVNADGVFFTWDGGAAASQALDADDCVRCGIQSEADLQPLVLRWDVASFLTVEAGRVIGYTTADQGQTWQREQLLTLGSDTLTARCCTFAGTGQGFAALGGTDADGAPWCKVFETVDDGASWTRIPAPVGADGVVRVLNGLCFYDGACGVATAPGGAGDPWPRVFATMDGGQTWVEPDIPFGDSGQTGADRVTELYLDESGSWQVTFTQEGDGGREIVFETADLAHGSWAFDSLHAAS